MNKSLNPNKSFLGYPLNPYQDCLINHVLPSISSYLLYISLFSIDSAVIYRLYHDNNPILASLSFFFVFLPSLGCYIFVMSSLELWPQSECSSANVKWAFLKTVQHVFFPVWSVWRYAERIFWSIEAVRSETRRQEALKFATASRTVELYFFLQAYLHCLPQMLLQTQLLIRNDLNTDPQTVTVQVLSLVLNLTKISVVTSTYQRFKSQKLAGKQYPWFKEYKCNPFGFERGALQSSRLGNRRRSSDFYLEPVLRETSVLDGPERAVYTETDFGVRRVVFRKGLPEDDVVGKLVSFFWWFCFLLARILAVSAFAYFYKSGIVWMLSIHFLLIMTFLLYDVKVYDVNRSKMLFFVFLGFIFLFCVIEFKIKFKKTSLVYLLFFTLVYLENFIMCLIWWFKNLDFIQNDFWFRYMFYLIVMCSIFSLSSMVFYLNINKPKKVIVGTRVL